MYSLVTTSSFLPLLPLSTIFTALDSLSLSKLQSLALTAAAAKEKLGHHTGNIYRGLCFIGVALGFRLKYRNVLCGLTNKVNVCYKSRGNWVKSGRY